MASKKTNEVVKVQTNQLSVSSLDSVPDYLKDSTTSGMEELGGSDFKIPRIKLVQALTPEVRAYPGVAIPGEFWHTAANVSLGNDVNIVVAHASKRVILFRPRESGGGILAFSPDAKNWISGANTKHEVTIKGRKDKVVYSTGKDVASSKLLDWGSSNPDDPNSPPAAILIYEYLCYLPDKPNLSPCVLGVYKTGVGNAKNFNTSMLMLRKPIASVMVNLSSIEETKGSDTWFVPVMKPNGYVSETIYKTAKSMADNYKEYQANYNDIVDEDNSTSSAPTDY